MDTVPFSVLESATDNHPKLQELPIDGFIDTITGDPEISPHKEGEAWSPARYAPGALRRKDQVLGLSCMGLDFDRGQDGKVGLTPEDSQKLFNWLADTNYKYAAHNTFSSGSVYPREKLRLVLFFSREVKASEYARIWHALYDQLPVKPDKACADATRIYFSPRIPTADHLKYYQRNTDGEKFIDVEKLLGSRQLALDLNGVSEHRDWLCELRTCKDKHNTLIRAAYWLGAEGYRLGYSQSKTIEDAWSQAERELRANTASDPVKDWSLAQKTARKQASEGWLAEQASHALQAQAVESFRVTEKMALAATAALRKELKLVGSDYAQLTNASYRLGRYTPHVLNTEHVKKELFKAATQSHVGTGQEGFITGAEAHAAIDTGVARGQKNPLYIYTGWKSQLLIDQEKGTIMICDENAKVVFGKHPEVEGLLRWNVRRNMPFFSYAPPWETPKTDFPCPVADADATDAGHWLAKQLGRPLASSERTLRIMNQVAEQHSWDPFLEWLEGLQWDGQGRLDSWLHRVCKVEDNGYHKLVGSKFVLSAVARTILPGCDAQHVLVLVGRQGIGKSRALRELCGAEYFCANIGDIHKEEAVFNLQKYVIVELAELAAFRKAEMEVIKRFISDSSEDLRRKYARNSESIVRRAVLAGTTNQKEFLSDPSGNRRFWPVQCRHELDLDWLKDNREQLWAEAFDRVRRGEKWWPEKGETALAAVGINEYVDTDDLTSELDFFEKEFKCWPIQASNLPPPYEGQLDLQRKFKWVTVQQLHYIVGTEITSRPDQLRVSKMALFRGWEKTNMIVAGRNMKVWRI